MHGVSPRLSPFAFPVSLNAWNYCSVGLSPLWRSWSLLGSYPAFVWKVKDGARSL